MSETWEPLAPPVIGLVAPVPLDPTGVHGPTRGQARGARWRRTTPGLYVPSHVDATVVEQRVVEAAGVLGDRGVVTGWAALRMHGAGFSDGRARDGRTWLPVPVSANGARFDPHPAVTIDRATVPDDEVEIVHGVRCATVERALYDEMRRVGDLREAVVAADMAFAAQLTSRRRMRRYCADRRWSRGVRSVLEALDLTDEHSRSPQEPRFRLLWQLDGGWEHPLCNRTVLDLEGRFVAIPDLLDPVRGVVGEYAGAHHRDIDRHERDVDREAAIRAVGLEHVEVVGRDLARTDLVVRRMHDAAARVVPERRRWKLGPAPEPLDDVLDRRDAVERRRTHLDPPGIGA